ncbi:MAG: hypothetical protein ACXWTL_07710 [Methylobacter sp.]
MSTYISKLKLITHNFLAELLVFQVATLPESGLYLNNNRRHTGRERRTNSPGANWDVRRTGQSLNRRDAVSNPVYRDVDYTSHPWPLVPDTPPAVPDRGRLCRGDAVTSIIAFWG